MSKIQAQWEFSHNPVRCDECGKHSHVVQNIKDWFYTMDGGDYLEYNYCWRCQLVSIVSKPFLRLRYVVKRFKFACKIAKLNAGKADKNFWDWYKLAKSIYK